MLAFRVFSVVFVVFALLLPASVGAESNAPVHVYIPLVAGGIDQGPEMVQFRSCGGYGRLLQFKEVLVGDLSALSEDCEGGSPYPSPIAGENEGVALGGYYIGALNWHIVPQLGLYYDQDVQFEVTLASGGSSPSTYINVNVRDGKLSIDQGGVVFTSPTTIEGWDISFYLEAIRPYIEFAQGRHTIWVVLEDSHGIIWVEIQTPRVIDDSEPGQVRKAWGAWYEALQNESQIPELADYIFDRYPLNGN
jgi:hypothetical protein